MEFCPQYCARIATEIYDKWRVLSWLLTAFGVHKVLRRKCRLTDYCRLFRISLRFYSYLGTSITILIYQINRNIYRNHKHILKEIKKLMNFLSMELHTSCYREWFATRFTFVIFVAFMNSVNVLLQIAYTQ